MPKRYSCFGAEVSPPLEWRNVPTGTKELALVVVDITGPVVHWVVRGLDPSTSRLAEGQTPRGAVTVSKYLGPCPNGGISRYEFTIYALPQPLNIGPAQGQKDALAKIDDIAAAATARGELTGTYPGI